MFEARVIREALLLASVGFSASLVPSGDARGIFAAALRGELIGQS